MLSLIGSAMERELSTGIDVFLSALRNAGLSTDSVSDDQPPEFESFQEEEEFEELDEVTLIEERLPLATDPPGIETDGLVIHCVQPEWNVRRML